MSYVASTFHLLDEDERRELDREMEALEELFEPDEVEDDLDEQAAEAAREAELRTRRTHWGRGGGLSKGVGLEYKDVSGAKIGGEVTTLYLQEKQRERYEVTMGATLTRMKKKHKLDTGKSRQHYRKKNVIAAMADLGAPIRNPDGKPTLPWQRDAMMWVILFDENIGQKRYYSGVCRAGVLHHSSFGAGGVVRGAGEWVVRDGRLLGVSANSGHYKPDLTLFARSLRLMIEAHNGDTVVLMYDKDTQCYVERPLQEFLNKPSGGGRYFVNKALATGAGGTRAPAPSVPQQA